MLLKAAGCIVSYWFEQMNYTYKKIWLIAFPVMMSILIEQLINITDALFLGHVGDVELGASALAGIWFLAIYMLGFGFSLGLQVVIARRNGEQQYAETGKTFFQGLFFLLILAVLLCLLSKIFSPVLLKHLITSDMFIMRLSAIWIGVFGDCCSLSRSLPYARFWSVSHRQNP